MDLDKLVSSYHLLLEQMERDGYSAGYIKAVEWEVKWIKRHPELWGCNNYLELYEKRLTSGRSSISSQGRTYHKRSIFTLLQHFEEDGEFPNHREKIPLVKRAAYYHLNPYYKSAIDCYQDYAKRKNHAEWTIKKCISKTSCFFLYLQNKGND